MRLIAELTPRLKLALIGFVFLEPQGDLVFITPFCKEACVGCLPRRIGFVWRNNIIIARPILVRWAIN
jgi:hypothetical protein